jgi:hypothetical protein
LTSGITKPRNPKLNRGKVTGACRGRDRERAGPVDRVFIRDSSRESNELIRLKGEFERSCEQERDEVVASSGIRACLHTASSGIRA